MPEPTNLEESTGAAARRFSDLLQATAEALHLPAGESLNAIPAAAAAAHDAAKNLREQLNLALVEIANLREQVDARQIPLTKGYVALVDAADYDTVMAAAKWSASVAYDGVRIYAKRSIRRPDGSKSTESLHTFLTGWPYVDHINGNGLDNRRANLRPATAAQNNRNARLSSNNASGFKGVHWDARRSAWRACISVNGSGRTLGYFDTPEEAASAYDAAAREHYGEYARPNFPVASVPSRRAQDRPVDLDLSSRGPDLWPGQPMTGDRHLLIALVQHADGSMSDRSWPLTAEQVAAVVAPLGEPLVCMHTPAEAVRRLAPAAGAAAIVHRKDSP